MENILVLLLLFLPLGMVLLLANISEQRRLAAEKSTAANVGAYGCTTLLLATLVLVGCGIALAISTPEFSEVAEMMPMELSSPALAAYGMLVPALIGLLCLLKPVRRLLATIIPIDPDSHVHAIALAIAMLVPISTFFTSGIGLGTLADAVEGVERSTAATLLELWGQQLLTAGLAIIAVGYTVRRSPRKTFERLGITRISARQLITGIVIALVMSFLVNLSAIPAESAGWISDDVSRLTESLLGAAFDSWYGILTIGLAAAIGEETLFRGALQPRFGLVLTTLLFVLAHSQYGFGFATGIVAVVGLILGIIRHRHNTTMAMVVHAVYNSSLLFTGQFVEWLFF